MINPTCVIVDDHETLRGLLLDWLQANFPHVSFRGVGSAEEALELGRAIQPLVFIMDIALPGMNGIEATRQIKRELTGARVVIHSIHSAQPYRDDAASAGADYYISKSKTQQDLLPVLLHILAPVSC